MVFKGITRRLAVGKVGAACVCLAARASHASAFPSRPVRVLVGAAPGGPSDFMARLFSDAATAALGQSFVVENRAGASGILAAAEAARAEPDGHTVLVAGPSTVLVAPHIVRKTSFTTENFVPVALLGAGAFVLAVHPSTPAHNLAQLMALIKAKPGVISFGSGGVGSSGHLCGELFARIAGGGMLHVPYKGDGLAVNDLVSGQIQVMFTAPNVAMAHVRSGRLRVLAVTSRERLTAMPQTPTVHEAGIRGFEYLGWIMTLAPVGTPLPIVALLAQVWDEARDRGTLKARLEALDMLGPDHLNKPEALALFLKAERARLVQVIREANIRVESGVDLRPRPRPVPARRPPITSWV